MIQNPQKIWTISIHSNKSGSKNEEILGNYEIKNHVKTNPLAFLRYPFIRMSCNSPSDVGNPGWKREFNRYRSEKKKRIELHARSRIL